jgi:hypothetical protein
MWSLRGGLWTGSATIPRRQSDAAVDPPSSVGGRFYYVIADEAPLFLFSRSSSRCSTLCFGRLMDGALGGMSAARMPLSCGAPLLFRCEVEDDVWVVDHLIKG